MSQQQSNVGKIEWVDLTVPDAPRLRDFYHEVIGWEPSPVAMGDYSDFNMTIPGGATPAAGICHARGGNASIPPQWMIYVSVADAKASAAACMRLGGKIVVDRAPEFYILQDPAGAVMAIMQAKGKG
jgi:predicted enzyme related to lactoylglutathione lyase